MVENAETWTVSLEIIVQALGFLPFNHLLCVSVYCKL